MSDKGKDLVRLTHLLNAIASIEEFTNDIDFSTFSNSDLLQSAVIRKFEIIGEAATAVSEHTKDMASAIPWHKIKGLRNILIHEYFKIDASQLWETIQYDLPDLKAQIENLIAELS